MVTVYYYEKLVKYIVNVMFKEEDIVENILERFFTHTG